MPSTTIDLVRNAQQIDGSWSFNGDNTGSDGGADTTGLAVLALVDAGFGASDPDVSQALDYLVAGQQPDGGWSDGFSENPNTASVAMLGLAAGGRTAPLAAGDAYLLGLQQSDGRIASPYDSAAAQHVRDVAGDPGSGADRRAPRTRPGRCRSRSPPRRVVAR